MNKSQIFTVGEKCQQYKYKLYVSIYVKFKNIDIDIKR